MYHSKENIIRQACLFFGIMASGGNLIISREIWVVLTILCCIHLLKWNLPIFASRFFIYIWIGAVILLLFYSQGASDFLSIASRAATFFAALLLLEVYLNRSIDRLMADLHNILRFMSMQAIITCVLAYIAGELFSVVNVAGTDYYTLGFLFNFHYTQDDVTRFIRPDGFFYEPGVYQIYISIFMYLCLFWRLSIFWAVVSLIAQITLWSTIGMVLTVVLFGFSARQLFCNLRGSARALVFFAYILTLPIVIFLAIFNYDQKVNGELSGSHLARQYDFYTGINIIEEKPLTGIGFGLDNYLKYNRNFGYSESELRFEQTVERPNSNGLVQVLYTIGLPLGVPIFVGIFTQCLFRRNWLMAAVLVGSFYGQSIIFTPFFLFIMFSGLIIR